MSLQAMTWVLEEAPDVPPHLVAPLLGLANHADAKGRNAYPSTATICWYTRKGRKTVQDDLDKLEELGLIRRGDQRVVLYLPPDDRPVVYDLAMELKREPRPERKRRPGRPTKAQVSAPPINGGVYTPPRLSDPGPGGCVGENGGVYRGKRGGLHTPLTVLEPSLNQTPPREADDNARRRTPRPRSGGETTPPETPAPPAVAGCADVDDGDALNEIAATAAMLREGRGWSVTQTTRMIGQALRNGHTWPEVEIVLLRISSDPETRGPARLLAVPAAYWDDAARGLKPPPPEWCGECSDPRTRRLFDPTTGEDLGRCPVCHFSVAA